MLFSKKVIYFRKRDNAHKIKLDSKNKQHQLAKMHEIDQKEKSNLRNFIQIQHRIKTEANIKSIYDKKIKSNFLLI